MTKKMQLLTYSTLKGIIIVSAYFGLIPTRLHDIPFYDSAGHFVLYGFWGYFFGNAFDRPIASVANFQIPSGIIVTVIIAAIEEFLQQLSPMRSFSVADLGFGLLGIALACVILNLKQHR